VTRSWSPNRADHPCRLADWYQAIEGHTYPLWPDGVYRRLTRSQAPRPRHPRSYPQTMMSSAGCCTASASKGTSGLAAKPSAVDQLGAMRRRPPYRPRRRMSAFSIQRIIVTSDTPSREPGYRGRRNLKAPADLQRTLPGRIELDNAHFLIIGNFTHGFPPPPPPKTTAGVWRPGRDYERCPAAGCCHLKAWSAHGD